MFGKFKKQIAGAIILLGIILMAVPEVKAQTQKKRNVLPRVGVVKNLEEIKGKIFNICTSHFIQPTKDSVKNEYIFIATSFFNVFGNFDVVMNLDGRNVWLVPLGTMLRYDTRNHRVFAHHEYRAARTRVTVSFEVQTDAIYPHPAKIIIRNGSSSRTIRAFVVEQCSGGE